MNKERFLKEYEEVMGVKFNKFNLYRGGFWTAFICLTAYALEAIVRFFIWLVC